MRINRRSDWKTPSRTSPKGGPRGCLCPDNTYDKDCCDGTIHAQGIGVITGEPVPFINFLLQETQEYILLEDGSKIIL